MDSLAPARAGLVGDPGHLPFALALLQEERGLKLSDDALTGELGSLERRNFTLLESTAENKRALDPANLDEDLVLEEYYGGGQHRHPHTFSAMVDAVQAVREALDTVVAPNLLLLVFGDRPR